MLRLNQKIQKLKQNSHSILSSFLPDLYVCMINTSI